MASFEEEGSARTFIRHPCECLAAPDHGIRDDGLIGIDGDVLHGDLLLTFSAVAVERLGKQRYGSGGLVGERKVSRTTLEALARKPCSPVKVERGGIGGKHLGTEHALHRIAGIN